MVKSCAGGERHGLPFHKMLYSFDIIAITRSNISNNVHFFLISTIGFCSGTRDEFYCVSDCSDE